ncbi:hypothetical protein RAS2_15380 [Phycisphaerae bacterium RAS2]|nr:hypothetical protein RAS2_15380 [Phycisphaerae bacterium RAS2]
MLQWGIHSICEVWNRAASCQTGQVPLALMPLS